MLRMLTVAVLTGIGTLSDVQTQVLQRARDRTPEISAGEQKLLALLRSEATQAYLRQFDDGSKLHELDPLVPFRRLISVCSPAARRSRPADRSSVRRGRSSMPRRSCITLRWLLSTATTRE